MKIFYTGHYVLPLPAGHRFPMAKYSLLRERVEEAGLASGQGLREPHAATDEEILRAHDSGRRPDRVHLIDPRSAADLRPSKRRGAASLPRFVTSRALQLRNRAFCFSNVENS